MKHAHTRFHSLIDVQLWGKKFSTCFFMILVICLLSPSWFYNTLMLWYHFWLYILKQNILLYNILPISCFKDDKIVWFVAHRVKSISSWKEFLSAVIKKAYVLRAVEQVGLVQKNKKTKNVNRHTKTPSKFGTHLKLISILRYLTPKLYIFSLNILQKYFKSFFQHRYESVINLTKFIWKTSCVS